MEILNFLSNENKKKWYGDIVTNPPYKYALEFVEKALSLIEKGRKVAMFLRIQFLEGQRRRKLFDKEPPKTEISKNTATARSVMLGLFGKKGLTAKLSLSGLTE